MVRVQDSKDINPISLNEQSLTKTDKVIVLFILLYWLAYENVIFFWANEIGGSGFMVATYALKFFIPFGLLFFSGICNAIFSDKYTKFYLLFFILFLAWIFITTAINGDVIEWLKLVPRLAFFISVFSLFYKRPILFFSFSKIMVIYVIYALFQYILIYITGSYSATIEVPFGRMTDILGLYANVTAMMYFPSTPLPFIRLSSYWCEPSNAAASCFASFYLALYLYANGFGTKWKKMSYLCFTAGVLTLSNAGYFALALSILGGVFFVKRGSISYSFRYKLILLIVAFFMILIVAYGRDYVRENYVENDLLRAFVGLRELNVGTADGGRIELASNILDILSNNFFGVGLGNSDVGDDNQSASALFFWLLIGGYFGVVLLLLRDFTVALSFRKSTALNSSHIYLIQAFIVVMAQQLSYGSWMNPNYFILVAAVLAFNAKLTSRIALNGGS